MRSAWSTRFNEYQNAVVWHYDLVLFGGNGRVLVLAQGLLDGTIHAQGTHEKLLETCPLYRDMWQAHIGAKDQM